MTFHKRITTAFLSLSIFIAAIASAQHIHRKDYLKYAKEAADEFWSRYDEHIKAWAENIDVKNVFGYNPPGNVINFAYVNAWLFKLTGEKKYAIRARKSLVEYRQFKKYYPDEFWSDLPGFEADVPPIPSFFSVPNYVHAYRLVKDCKHLSQSDKAEIEKIIAESCDYQVRYQEWGAMNRGILRAEMLYIAAITLPEHPNASTWRMVAESIIDDCWGRWEIEDATLYNGIYLYSLVNLVEFINESEFWQHAVTRYTMQFYVHQMAPHGMLPDYGDAHLYANWIRFLPVFEKAAKIYRDPEIKYAANRLLNSFWDAETRHKSIWHAAVAIDCYRWADDSIQSKEPAGKSELVLDDVIGKKVVFRTGYQPNDTYLMVNYKDEGIAGFLSRDYLRTTIPVEEEKMTHGHSDENDITLLMTDGCILLHDGGYRDYMPSGVYGAYRADYFHNRVVVREDKLFKGQKKGEYRYATRDPIEIQGQNVLDFVRNSGAYKPVRTELIDFLVTENFDYSRTRVIDDKTNYQHDRIVNWVKPLNIFVVFDVVKFLEDNYYTTVNFWHTRKILARGDKYFDTQYDSLMYLSFPTHKSLLIYFPEKDPNGLMIGADLERRYWQDEYAIHQAYSGWYYDGNTAVFSTVLVPHDTTADVQKIMDRISRVQVDRYPAAIGVKIEDSGKTYYVCSKLDRRLDIHHQDARPQYNYEQGKICYDKFETDAHQLFAILHEDIIDYTALYCVKVAYNNRVLFERVPVPFGLQFSGAPPRTGVAKVRYWKDKVKLNR